jgi:hypothetical protein
MLTPCKHKLRSRDVVAVTLACATVLTLLATGQTLARPADLRPISIVFINQPTESKERAAVAESAEKFITGMADHNAAAVWMFASEEDQDAFGTEAEVYAAYQETFPEFATAREVTFTRFWQEGDTPFTQVLLGDGHGGASVATMGFWLDDAGDWKLVSCEVKPVSNRLAGL